MNALETFFQGPETQFGIFYPTHYVVAIFKHPVDAATAQRHLRNSIFDDKEVIAVSGEEVADYARHHLQKVGLWTLLMSQVSRLIGTEAVYADQDLAMAESGCSFVVVYAPTEAAKNLAWRLLDQEHPIVGRYYARAGIEVLRGAGADHVVPPAIATENDATKGKSA